MTVIVGNVVYKYALLKVFAVPAVAVIDEMVNAVSLEFPVCRSNERNGVVLADNNVNIRSRNTVSGSGGKCCPRCYA